nr:hypothetical protein [Tanacetum cinerariifolium]
VLRIEEGHVIIGGAVEEGSRRRGLPIVDIVVGERGREGRIRIGQHCLTEGVGKQLALLRGHRSKRVGL